MKYFTALFTTVILSAAKDLAFFRSKRDSSVAFGSLRMTVLFFLFGLSITFPAVAQTPVSDEMARAYYDSCMGQRDQRMSSEAQDSLCTCTAKKMQETMSVEDIRTMGQNDQVGRDMLNKMLIDVYAPCMAEPLAEILEDQCLLGDDKKIKHMHKANLCACMAEKTGAWFATGGRNAMAEVLAANPNINDPIGPVMDSPLFKEQTMTNITACMPAKKGRN